MRVRLSQGGGERMIGFWDHAAHWTEVIGDRLSTPWFRLSRYCYGRWRRAGGC